MYGFMPEELSWAMMQEHEFDARRAATRTSPRPKRRWLRSAVARKLVKTGLRLDERAGAAVLQAAAKAGY